MPPSAYRDLLGSAWSEALAQSEEAAASPSDRFAEYRGREEAFVEEVLGVKMWAAGRAMFRSAFENKRTVVRSGRKVAKTHTLGCILVAYVNVWEAAVISMAPTHRQVKVHLWGEVHKLYNNARKPLLGTPDQTQILVGPAHYALGFSTDDPGRAQGFHVGASPPADDPDRDLTPEELMKITTQASEGLACDDDPGSKRRLVFLMDEGAEIKQPIYEAISGSLQGPNVRLVMPGNPTGSADDEREFHRACRPGSGVHRIKIAAVDIPDPLDADEEFIGVPNWLCDPEWLESCRVQWGEESALFKAYCGGVFAGVDAERRVITPTLLEAALGSEVNADVGRHLGIDIADQGGDMCVASLWDKGGQIALTSWQYHDNPAGLMETVHHIRSLRAKWGKGKDPLPAGNVHLDSIGIGAGVCARLHEMGIPVEGVDFGKKARLDWVDLTEEAVFYNRRAELHWVLRRALQEGLAKIPRELHGKPNPTYSEAMWPTFDEVPRASGTAIRIRKKDDIKKDHGGKSPDHLDAALYAWSRGGTGPVFGVRR